MRPGALRPWAAPPSVVPPLSFLLPPWDSRGWLFWFFFFQPCPCKVFSPAGWDELGGKREAAFSSSLSLPLCRNKLLSRDGSRAPFTFWGGPWAAASPQAHAVESGGPGAWEERTTQKKRSPCSPAPCWGLSTCSRLLAAAAAAPRPAGTGARTLLPSASPIRRGNRFVHQTDPK